MNDLLVLLKMLYPHKDLLTHDELQELMAEHASLAGSGNAAAAELGVDPSYWHAALSGRRAIGPKVLKGYHVERVTMYRIVEE